MNAVDWGDAARTAKAMFFTMSGTRTPRSRVEEAIDNMSDTLREIAQMLHNAPDVVAALKKCAPGLVDGHVAVLVESYGHAHFLVGKMFDLAEFFGCDFLKV